MPRTTDEKLVHIIPVPGVHIPGEPAVEQDVTEAEWQRLDAYTPAAFTRNPSSKEDTTPKEGS